MKIKYKLMLFPVLAVLLTGCEVDLTLQSTKPSLQNPNEAMMQGLLTTAYSTLTINRAGYGYALWGSVNGCDTDESFYKTTSNTDVTTIGLHNCNSSTIQVIPEMWRALYEIIESSNIVIGMADNVNMNTTDKADMVGQAKTLRAFAHFMLAVHYGPVPIRNIPMDKMDTLDLPRNSMKEVCDFAVRELRQAAPMLKEIIDRQSTAYITKSVAEGLSLRVGLFLASHPAIQETAMYDSVAVWGKQLIGRNVRSLNTSPIVYKTINYPAYANVFMSNMMNMVSTAQNSESMWDCTFYMKSNVTGTYQSWNGSYVNYIGSYMGVDCVDANITTSTVGYCNSNYRPQASLWKKYEKGDLRRDWNFAPYCYKSSNYQRYNYIDYTLPTTMGTPATAARLTFVVKGQKLVDETIIDDGGTGYTDGTYPNVKVNGYNASWVSSGTPAVSTGSTGTLFTITVTGGKITSVKMQGTSATGYVNVYSRGIGKWRREFEVLPSYLTAAREQYNTSCNFPILRYADVLLMTAEAALFANPSTVGAASVTDGLDYINKVRNRAGLDNISSYDLAYIQDERSRELCFEGLRRMDLIRWGYDKYKAVYDQLLTDVTTYGTDGAGNYYGDAIKNAQGNNEPKPVYSIKALMGYYQKYTLMPIPAAEMGRASSTFYQNPGW